MKKLNNKNNTENIECVETIQDDKIKENKSEKIKESIRVKKERRKVNAYLLPSFMGVMLFFIVPFFVVIYYSMIDNIYSKKFIFLKNFKMVIENKAFLMAAKNTLIFTFTAVPLAVVLSLLLAILLMSNIPGKSQLRTCFLTPLMVPVASVVLIFQVLFNYNGVMNDFIRLFGADKIDWLKSKYAMIVIILLFLWKNLGYNMILFMAALGSVPKNSIEVARLDCSSDLKIFFKVKLKYISPTILFVTVLSMINSFKVFREVYLLSGDYPYETLYMLQHFMNNTFVSMDYQKMSAAAVIMFDIMVLIIGILFVIENRYGKDVENS